MSLFMNAGSDDRYYWADTGDNRVGPIMRELIDAMHDCDADKLSRVATRLKFLSSEMQSLAHRKRKEERGF